MQLDEEPALMVLGPDATMQSSPQDIQLMSKHWAKMSGPTYTKTVMRGKSEI